MVQVIWAVKLSLPHRIQPDRRSHAANGAFLALFLLSLLAFSIQVILSTRFIGSTTAMVNGCLLELLGYIGRSLSYQNLFGEVEHWIKLLLPFAFTDHITRTIS